jgi:multimeric flavodoxin WrbA
MTDSRDARDARNVRLVAICGSLREESKTRIALRTALDAAADAGAETTLVDLREYACRPSTPTAGSGSQPQSTAASARV